MSQECLCFEKDQSAINPLSGCILSIRAGVPRGFRGRVSALEPWSRGCRTLYTIRDLGSNEA